MVEEGKVRERKGKVMKGQDEEKGKVRKEVKGERDKRG